MKNTVHKDATSGNLKGKPMTKTIGLHWLQQVTKHVPATDEVSVHRAQLHVKPLLMSENDLTYCTFDLSWQPAPWISRISNTLQITYHTIEIFEPCERFLLCFDKNLWQAAKIFFGCRNGEKVLTPTYDSAPSILL